MKIIDCFIFYNEIELLTYRINLLNNVVDYFIIVESSYTFTGKKKNLFYNENKHLFEKFSDKIIYIILNNLPYIDNNKIISPEQQIDTYHKTILNLIEQFINNNDIEENNKIISFKQQIITHYDNVLNIIKQFINNNSNNISNIWNNEYYQRNAIALGINNIQNLSDTDIIIISDIDEIPDPFTLNRIKNGDIIVDINVLEMDMYYYNLNTRLKNKWPGVKIITYKKYNELNISCNGIRYHPEGNIIKNGGWHLSYFGDELFIQNKIQNFSHQEFNTYEYTNLDKINEKIKNNMDLYNRNIDIEQIKIEDNTYLPPEYFKYLNKYYNL